jgi:DNA modification methylase
MKKKYSFILYMTFSLHNGNCLEIMKELKDDSIDLMFCDLPYCGITNSKKDSEISCKWNTPVDLDLFWKQANRICKINCPMFFTCTTKFGVSLINSNPKNFRYDLVWIKSSACGFLNAKKLPMRKHELIYVFYRKLPYYDLSSHKCKFIKEDLNYKVIDGNSLYGNEKEKKRFLDKNGKISANDTRYNPPLPNSIIKEENCKYDIDKNIYGGGEKDRIKISKKKEDHETKYDPPLPNSVIKTELYSNKGDEKPRELYRNKDGQYDPPLPNSVIRDTTNYKNDSDLYGNIERTDYMRKKNESVYEPPLPNSIIKENKEVYNVPTCHNENWEGEARKGTIYDPELPTSILEIKSQKGKHATQKPVALMNWCIKYYSKEGDTILDPTMGSGSTGVSCKEMKRNFVGIELDKDIFETARKRIEEN